MTCASLFGCCISGYHDETDDVRSIGLGRMKYTDRSQKSPLLTLTNGENEDNQNSFFETPAYVVEASVVTVSGLQPVQVFEGTIFHESERRGLKKYSAANESSAKKKRRQSQNSETKQKDLDEFQQAAKQLLRCGQMLYGSGQQEFAGIMFERSLQVCGLVRQCGCQNTSFAVKFVMLKHDLFRGARPLRGNLNII